MLIEAIATEVPKFFELVRSNDVEIYNEFSLQHELGIVLRSRVPAPAKIHFERPVGFFQPRTAEYEKKEIDISIFTPDRADRVAIELKFPRNGQYPEQMFKACSDIAFLEQLVRGGFSAGIFVMAADDPLFRTGRDVDGIYAHFRVGSPIAGRIRKPTGKSDRTITMRGRYVIEWHSVSERLNYCMVQVHSADAHGHTRR